MRLEVEDRPEREEQSRLPKSIAYEDRQEKRVGKAGKQRQPGALSSAEARRAGRAARGAPSSSARMILQRMSARCYRDRVTTPHPDRYPFQSAATSATARFELRRGELRPLIDGSSAIGGAGWSSKWTIAKFRPAASRTS